MEQGGGKSFCLSVLSFPSKGGGGCNNGDKKGKGGSPFFSSFFFLSGKERKVRKAAVVGRLRGIVLRGGRSKIRQCF